MKYYSEVTKRMYEDVKVLEKEEAAAIKKAQQDAEKAEALKKARAERAKEVEDAFKAASEAEKRANQLLETFLRDYGSFHSTIKEIPHPYSLFDFLFNF